MPAVSTRAGSFRALHPAHEIRAMTLVSRSQHVCMAKINERHVLRVIHDHGPSSRAEVVRYSGLSAPTLSKAAPALEQAGLLD
jgi:glucokinase